MTFSITIQVSSQDAIEGWYGSRDDSWDDIEKFMFVLYSDKLIKN
jgi:hypothetical protein